MPAIHIELTSEPILSNQLSQLVSDPGCGATVTFLGTVRDEHYGKPVDRLEYAAYSSMAESEMKKIAEELICRWSAKSVSMVHRLGVLEIGETSIGIAISFPHRAESFEALKFAIDTFKETVPIWKREFFSNGEAIWVEGS